ncbi:MAG: hypothetical protein ACXIUM_11960 [Wenzhouxiangella sp.]
MDWNRAREQWQTRADQSGSKPLAELAEPARLWTIIRRRDWIETAVAIFGAVFFGAMSIALLLGGLQLAALFGLWLTGVCVYIPLRLRHARRLIPTPDPGRPVIEFLRAERAALVGQRELLGSVWRWYWGPIAIGVIGFFVSIVGWGWKSATYVLIVVAVSAAFEYLNRQAIRQTITPGLDALDRQIQDMENEDEDNTRAVETFDPSLHDVDYDDEA